MQDHQLLHGMQFGWLLGMRIRVRRQQPPKSLGSRTDFTCQHSSMSMRLQQRFCGICDGLSVFHGKDFYTVGSPAPIPQDMVYPDILMCIFAAQFSMPCDGTSQKRVKSLRQNMLPSAPVAFVAACICSQNACPGFLLHLRNRMLAHVQKYYAPATLLVFFLKGIITL